MFREARVPADWPGNVEAMMRWLVEGYDLHDDILPAIRKGAQTMELCLSLRLFDPIVRRKRASQHRRPASEALAP